MPYSLLCYFMPYFILCYFIPISLNVLLCPISFYPGHPQIQIFVWCAIATNAIRFFNLFAEEWLRLILGWGPDCTFWRHMPRGLRKFEPKWLRENNTCKPLRANSRQLNIFLEPLRKISPPPPTSPETENSHNGKTCPKPVRAGTGTLISPNFFDHRAKIWFGVVLISEVNRTLPYV